MWRLPLDSPGPSGAGLRHQGNAGSGRRGDTRKRPLRLLLGSPEGAYKIGVIGWEASKVLKHAKETRHIFDGHPRSSQPSAIKVLAMFDDCIRYVLNEPYPSPIVDLDKYIEIMDSPDFDRSKIAGTGVV